MTGLEQSTLEALAARLGKQLLTTGQTVVTAESCTGGWVGECITAVPGSSAWYDRGFVTYSYAAKTELLGVPCDLLATRGAVSEQVAIAMAEGAIVRSTADWSVAITGIAGPAGGTPEKPVGTVCFAWAGRNVPGRSSTFHFPGDRKSVRAQAVAVALKGLLDCTGQISA